MSTQLLKAGDLTSEHIGLGLWGPAYLKTDPKTKKMAWVKDFRRISMISHTTKGVKIRCTPSAHTDHAFTTEQVIKLTTEPMEKS